MIMILGGAFQGKRKYALEKTGYEASDFLDGKNCGMEEIFSAKGIYDFQEYIRRYLKETKDWETLADQLLQRNPELVLVTNELGYGVVPCEPQDRQWRECTGRICTKLAKKARLVIRVVCGIGMVLKDETVSHD